MARSSIPQTSGRICPAKQHFDRPRRVKYSPATVDFRVSACVCPNSCSKLGWRPPSSPGEPPGLHMVPENIQTFPSTSLTLGAGARTTPLDDLESRSEEHTSELQ